MSTYEIVKLVILLLVITGVVIAIVRIYHKITRKLRSISSQLLGTENFVEGLSRQANVLAEMPKSVNSMTRIMEPQIMRDFPEFSWSEFQHKAENVLRAALLAISADNPELLPKEAQDIRRQVENVIADNRANGIGEIYSNIEIHQTEIANYVKRNGTCVITIQCAVGYLHYKVQDGKVIEGDKDRKQQTKYNLELIYIQDVDTNTLATGVGTTCPNCGAPVKMLGAKFCEYCGSGIEAINIKVWSLHKFYEVDYN